MSRSTTLVDLRRLLSERFPGARAPAARCVETGLPTLDEQLGGGFACGAFTELVSACPSAGGQLITGALIRATRLARRRLVLLDPGEVFSPDQWEPGLLAHLVWVRGGQLKEFWLVADLLLRDANFAAVVMDLRRLPERELRRTPATTWYRLQRVIEQSEMAVLVHTDFALVPCATRRLVLSQPMTLAALAEERWPLASGLQVRLQLQRSQARVAG